MSSVKLTKKKLRETGENFNAYYLGGNVYDYENIIYYLEQKQIENIDNNNSIELKNYILINYKLEDINISSKQLFYSCGVYGNNGQLHKISIYNKDWSKLIDTLFVYYC